MPIFIFAPTPRGKCCRGAKVEKTGREWCSRNVHCQRHYIVEARTRIRSRFHESSTIHRQLSSRATTRTRKGSLAKRRKRSPDYDRGKNGGAGMEEENGSEKLLATACLYNELGALYVSFELIKEPVHTRIAPRQVYTVVRYVR